VLQQACWLVATLLGGSALAQTTIYVEQDKLIRGSRDVATLGADLFGDQVSLYNGNVEFRQTDVSLPGNNALSVAVGRRLAGSTEVRLAGLFDDWDLDIPHLHGVFKSSSGWVTNSGTQARCSGFGAPDPGYFQWGSWNPDEYWHGSFIYLPGQGSQEILTRSGTNPNYPGDGNNWPLTTQSLVSIRCLGSMARGTGEGFLAVTPDGTQYRFDWMVSRNYPWISKPTQQAENRAAGTGRRGSTGALRLGPTEPTPNVAESYILARQEVWILPTQVTDRHGNTVTYTYDPSKPWRLTSITASDGRSITLSYDGTSNRVATVSDGTRTWSYTYSNGLNRVTQPDGAQWQFSMSAFTQAPPMYVASPTCDLEGSLGGWTTGSMTHPSGAVGTFKITPTSHGRSFVERECRGDPSYGDIAVYPRFIASRSLVSKVITGPGLDTMTWSYTYSPVGAAASWSTCTGNCPDTKTVEVTDPRNVLTRYTFGNRYRVTEGQLQKVEVGPAGGTALRTTTLHYRDPAAGPYPSFPGISPQRRGNGELASRHTPQDQRVITQQGKTFSWVATTFDERARAVVVTKSSNLNSAYSRTEYTTYQDIPAKWVLGQVASVTAGGTVSLLNTYDLGNGNLLSTSKFGKLEASYTYYPSSSPPTPNDGALWAAKDGLNHTTTYSNYMRGLAQTIAYADGTQESAVVHNIGVITSHTNAAGTTHNYGYDAMGRLMSITPPGGDAVGYNATTLSFQAVPSAEYGLPAGHWRQTVTTGGANTVKYFDGLWRPVLSLTYDAANVAGTSSMVQMRYDADSRKRFASYPQRGITAFDAAVPGTAWQYDALGRVELQTQDSELGPLYTQTAYLDGLLRRVTNPRGFVTTSAFQAFDTPTEDAITAIAAPEGVSVAISRDVFGKPLSITRAGGAASVTRSYVYDAYHQLCKTIEPESGATVQGYDAAGNLTWRASGQNFPGPGCETTVAASQLVSFGYDLRNRLTNTTYGDGSQAITRSYTPDGLLQQIVASDPYNPITWKYHYNNRRLLTREQYDWRPHEIGEWDGWNFTYFINENGHVATFGDPWGNIDYTPNALGEPTQVSGYASGVTYHPSGAVAGYTLANGVTHSTTLNARGLPLRMSNTGVTQDAYTYDANGNIASIIDEQEGVNSRSMPPAGGYDGLDRLRQVNGPWGTAGFTYDALDNLVSSALSGAGAVPARSLSHTIDAATNRLTGLTGSQNITIGYDANGNVTQRGTQSFVFDIGNRMRNAVGKATYLYDGHGRRNLAWFAGGDYMHQAYTKDGKLRAGWRPSEEWHAARLSGRQADCRESRQRHHVFPHGCTGQPDSQDQR
jgi:YD repeat-containing protein